MASRAGDLRIFNAVMGGIAMGTARGLVVDLWRAQRNVTGATVYGDYLLYGRENAQR